MLMSISFKLPFGFLPFAFFSQLCSIVYYFVQFILYMTVAKLLDFLYPKIILYLIILLMCGKLLFCMFVIKCSIVMLMIAYGKISSERHYSFWTLETLSLCHPSA